MAAPTELRLGSPRVEMRYGEIARVRKPVSRFVLGVLDHTSDAPIERLLDEFFELGGNAVDTAWIYREGAHEQVLGRWLESRRARGEAVVIAKGAHTPLCTPEDLTRQLFESLDRLRTDHVDVYLVHRDNDEVPVGEFVDVLNEHQQAGRMRSFGVSNWTLERVRAANEYAKAQGLDGVAAVSNQLSLARMVEPLFPGCEGIRDPGWRDWLEEQQLAVLAFSSQARGFFARSHGGPRGLLRRTRLGRAIARSVELRLLRRPWEEARERDELARCWYGRDNFRRLGRVRKLAADRGVEPTAIAAAYVLSQPFPTFALIGPRTTGELHTSVAALGVDLSEDDLAWLDLS